MSGRLLAEAEGRVTPGRAGLEIAQGLDPLELGQVPGLVSSDHGSLMWTSSRGDRSEASQSAAGHGLAWDPAGPGPLFDGLETEARHGHKLGAQGAAIIAERDGGDERNLVFRPRPYPAELAAEIGIVRPEPGFEGMTRLTPVGPLAEHHCQSGFPFTLLGCRSTRETFGRRSHSSIEHGSVTAMRKTD